MKHKGKQQHMVITVLPSLLLLPFFFFFSFGSSDRMWGLDRILIRFISGTLMQPPPNRLTQWLSASEETLAWHDTADSGMSLVIRRRQLQAACIRIQRSPVCQERRTCSEPTNLRKVCGRHTAWKLSDMKAGSWCLVTQHAIIFFRMMLYCSMKFGSPKSDWSVVQHGVLAHWPREHATTVLIT